MAKSDNKQIVFIDLIILFVAATAYQLACDIPSISNRSDNRYKSLSSFIVLFSEITILIFLSHNILSMASLLMLGIILLGLLLMGVLIKYYYNTQLTILKDHYYDYYSGYMYALYILFIIVCFGYIFNTLIGVKTK